MRSSFHGAARTTAISSRRAAGSWRAALTSACSSCARVARLSLGLALALALGAGFTLALFFALDFAFGFAFARGFVLAFRLPLRVLAMIYLIRSKCSNGSSSHVRTVFAIAAACAP